MSSKIGLFEHFRRLADFHSREDRGSFWPYAALVFGILMVAEWIVMIPMMRQMQRATETGSPPSFAGVGTYLFVTFGLAIVLYGAAMVRRLRDSGRSGLWALMPLPFILFSSIAMPRFFSAGMDGGQSDLREFELIFISNALYTLTLLALIVLGDAEQTRQY